MSAAVGKPCLLPRLCSAAERVGTRAAAARALFHDHVPQCRCATEAAAPRIARTRHRRQCGTRNAGPGKLRRLANVWVRACAASATPYGSCYVSLLHVAGVFVRAHGGTVGACVLSPRVAACRSVPGPPRARGRGPGWCELRNRENSPLMRPLTTTQ